MSDESTNANSTNLVLWIVVALLSALLIGSIGIFSWLGLFGGRETRTVVQPAAVSTPSVSTGAAASFAGLAEAEVPGRYKIDDAGKVMYIFLNEDHSFINTDGTTYPPYRWDILPEGFSITWQRSSSTWTNFEGPRVFSGVRNNGTISRMEKLPDLPLAEMISINDKDVVASMTFAGALQTNGLALANTEGDGAIVAGEAGGQPCHHLMRQRSRMSAFLYARVAPELKTEPFTNALVMVEYFDSLSRDPRNGWISMQYDAHDGPYTSTAQRVKLSGSMQWTRATFVLDAPLFNGAETDQADFRLCVANPDLSIRAIKVVKNKPAVQRAPGASAN